MSPAALRRPPPVARVLRQVTQTARRHEMFHPGSLVIVAVSGGPDSVCLLHALVRLRRLFRIRLACFHFDHRLRMESGRDAQYVRSQAGRLGVPFFLRAAPTSPSPGDSVEAWARTVRYGALADLHEELGARSAAVGHTADDQAETVLLSLVRGGGLESLAGMRPVTGPLVRPLLEVTRDDTVRFCRSLRLRPREDPMNEDPSYLRVALRKRVLPLLEEGVGRNVRSVIARSAELLRRDADLLEAMAGTAFATTAVGGAAGARLRAARLVELPPSLAARVVRHFLLDAGLVPEAEHVAAVVALGSARPGTRVTLPAGLRASREKEYVRLSRPSPTAG
jgi:tRNA(Ile)-lysidine synthase